MSAATFKTLSRTARAAKCAEDPAVTVSRLFDVPIPFAIAPVSPIETVTFEGSPPSCAATTRASMVRVPWPMEEPPVATKMRPEVPIRTVADSNGPRPVPLT